MEQSLSYSSWDMDKFMDKFGAKLDKDREDEEDKFILEVRELR